LEAINNYLNLNNLKHIPGISTARRQRFHASLESPGKNLEKFGNFSRFFPGPHFLAFKLFNLFISLQSKEINRIKVLRGQNWGAGKKWGASSKAPVSSPLPAI